MKNCVLLKYAIIILIGIKSSLCYSINNENETHTKLSDTLNIINNRIVQLQNSLYDHSPISTKAIDYLSLATDYLEKDKYKKALEASIVSYYLSKDDDPKIKFHALLIIAQINVFWENAETGLTIYNTIDNYIVSKEFNVSSKLQLIISLGKSNALLKLNKPNETIELINNVVQNNHSNIEKNIYNEFVWNSGLAYFQKEQYQRAFDSLEKALQSTKSVYFEILLKHYKAKKNIKTNNIEKAHSFYLEIDSLLSFNNIAFPEKKEVYESINEYYRIKKDKTSQILFLNKYINELNNYSDNYNYISETTKDLYEVPRIINKKQKEINLLKTIKNKNLYVIFGISLFLLFLLVLLLIQVKKNIKYHCCPIKE